MHEIQDRLVSCFSTVFPTLSRTEILAANSESVPRWDSLAMVTLLAILEEEFAIQFQSYEVESLASFDAFYTHLKTRLSSVGTSIAAHDSAPVSK